VLREALAAAQPLAAARGSTLALDLPDGLPPARADTAALVVAVRNLLDNALQYGPPGTHVQVSVEPQGDRLWLHVDDDGPGIPPAERERVQERFVRGSTASAGAGGQAPPTGSGLGLAIVRRVAQRHDAPLRLDDAPQGGLRVSIGLGVAS
jgi:two-component system OmpR family sensor kinase